MLTIDGPIRTERLVLRPYIPADLDDLHAIRSRPDVARYLYGDAFDFEETRAALARKVGQRILAAENEALALAVVLPGATDRGTGVIGEVGLWWRSVEYRQGEIGFVFHPDHGGRGYATEAAAAMLDLAFDRLRLHRVYGRTDVRNTASVALMRRLGMREEAHFRENEWFKGEWGSELIFAILEDEWRARRGNVDR
jgi:RimJ/RimL family protein N-acetyltransferase